jgi:hypothetical protein
MKILLKIKRKLIELKKSYKYGFYYVKDTPYANEFYFILSKFIHRRERRKSDDYIKKQYENKIDQNILKKVKQLDSDGFVVLREPLPDAIFNSWVDRFSNIDWGNDKNMVTFKPWLQYYRLELDTSLERTAEYFMPYLAGYFRELPVLQSAYLWRSVPRDAENEGSQLWHLDHNDKKQIRMFIALDDINVANGALEIINRLDSDHIYRYLDTLDENNSRKKLHDNFDKYPLEFEQFFLELKKGDAGLIDTGVAYHRGSRDMRLERKALVLQFTTPWNLHLPIIRGREFISEKSQLKVREYNFVHLQENERLKRS